MLDVYNLEEAVTHCQLTIDSVEEALRYLSLNKSWGLYDIVVGNIFSSVLKHSKLQRANEAVRVAQLDLDKMANLLDEINFSSEDYRTVKGIYRRVDIAFDNALMDISVQMNIRLNIRALKELLRELNNLYYFLLAKWNDAL
ncbi:MAG TPA: hypothetical protein GX717_01660 [Clostridiaceae bacterium]|nr:hypothetical protein [Clostridiaceae bacterium]